MVASNRYKAVSKSEKPSSRKDCEEGSVEPQSKAEAEAEASEAEWLKAFLRMLDDWKFLHRGSVEYDWMFGGRTRWLKYQRYLREDLGLRHLRLSGKEVESIEPWFEVKLKDGTSKFVNGCCSHDSYERYFVEERPTGYLDTYEDPRIVRVSNKTRKTAMA